MRYMNTIVLSLILSACGVDDSSNEDSGAADKPVTLQSDETTAPTKAQHALLVEDASQLPLCDAEHEGLLVYVKLDTAFQVCGAGAWEEISLKGESGAAGADGKDGVDSSSTLWLDPMTGSRWAAAVASNWTIAMTACENGYHLPSKEDLLDAALHGLYSGLGTHVSAWSADEYSGGVQAYYVPINSSPAINNRVKTDVIGVYCMEDAAE